MIRWHYDGVARCGGFVDVNKWNKQKAPLFVAVIIACTCVLFYLCELGPRNIFEHAMTFWRLSVRGFFDPLHEASCDGPKE